MTKMLRLIKNEFIKLSKRRVLAVMLALTLVAAICVDVVGVLTLFDPFRGLNPSSLMILIATAFILNGALNIWTTAYTVRVKAKKKHLEEKYENDL